MKVKDYTKKIFEAVKSQWYMPTTEHQIYSTEEQVIGNFLGKPLYRKVVDFGALSSNATKSVAHGISNIDTLVRIDCFLTNVKQNHWVIPYAQATKTEVTTILPYISGANICIDNNSSVQDNCAVIIEYTKQTDTATTSKVPFEPLHEWSTEERLVGFWINGKPVFERTITVTLPTYTDNSTSIGRVDINHNIDNVDTIWIAESFFENVVGMSRSLNSVLLQDGSFPEGQLGGVLYAVANKTIIRILSNTASASGLQAYVTLRYTKSTD